MRILLVEDDDMIRESLTELLRMEGFDVETAANGREALDVLDHMKRPCVVVTDLWMPEMDGYELVRRLRADRSLTHVPVVVVSANADRSPRDVSLALRKPVRLSELLRELHHLCALQAEAHAPA